MRGRGARGVPICARAGHSLSSVLPAGGAGTSGTQKPAVSAIGRTGTAPPHRSNRAGLGASAIAEDPYRSREPARSRTWRENWAARRNRAVAAGDGGDKQVGVERIACANMLGADLRRFHGQGGSRSGRSSSSATSWSAAGVHRDPRRQRAQASPAGRAMRCSAAGALSGAASRPGEAAARTILERRIALSPSSPPSSGSPHPRRSAS